MPANGWIGVDLDKTLAEYLPGTPFNATVVGAPISKMVERVKQAIASGYEVRVFTARVANKHLFVSTRPFHKEAIQAEKAIEEWCLKHIGTRLVVTCMKDYQMLELWDDRAKQVLPNTGVFLEDDFKVMAYRLAWLEK